MEITKKTLLGFTGGHHTYIKYIPTNRSSTLPLRYLSLSFPPPQPYRLNIILYYVHISDLAVFFNAGIIIFQQKATRIAILKARARNILRSQKDRFGITWRRL